MANNWSEVLDDNGAPVVNASYFSMYGKPGEAAYTKANPGAFNEVAKGRNPRIIGCGDFVLSSLNDHYTYGLDKTMSKLQVLATSFEGSLRNLTIAENESTLTIVKKDIRNCTCERPIRMSQGSFPENYAIAYNCIFKKGAAMQGTFPLINNCTFLANTSVQIIGIFNQYHQYSALLFKDCVLDITGALNTSSSFSYGRWLAFDGCYFKIGSETDATRLRGNTIEELKADFINRCKSKAGVTVTLENLNRWAFSNNSTNASGEVLKDSMIAVYQESKGIYYGHSKPVDSIPIKDGLTAESFSQRQGEATAGIKVVDGLIYTDESTVGKRGIYMKESSLLLLNDELAITNFGIGHNLPIQNGVIPSISDLLVKVTLNNIEDGYNYIVRSSVASQEAVIEYGGTLYSSKLSSNQNIFRGVGGSNNATVLIGSPEIYKCLDLACVPVLAVRFRKNFIKTGITSGNLTPNYWYVVQATDANKTGTVTYNGTTYKHRMSFLATSASSFTATNANLSQAMDAAQKYVKVVATNPLIVLKDINTYEIIQGGDGELIGSAHPEFDAINSGISGVRPPIVAPFGTFYQVKIGINK